METAATRERGVEGAMSRQLIERCIDLLRVWPLGDPLPRPVPALPIAQIRREICEVLGIRRFARED